MSTTTTPACRFCGAQPMILADVLDWPALDDCGGCETASTRPQGRMSTGTGVHVRIPRHTLAVLDYVAAEVFHDTRAAMIRKAVTQMLNQIEPEVIEEALQNL